MPLTRFRNHQRVRVSRLDHPMCGNAGTVVRLRRADDGAWVDMDDALPGDLRSFPAGDEAGRQNHTILYPFECEVA